MKRMIILLTLFLLFLMGCSKEEENEETIRIQEQRIEELINEELAMYDRIEGLKDEHGIERFFVTISIKQSHFTLDISEIMKDDMNEIEIQIPVDEQYYDDVEVGDIIDDSFRMGSFVSAGSIGSWDIKVVDKHKE